MKIIVADDDLSQRLYLAALLRRDGHDCVLCASGSEVLAALVQSESALVVSDVQMPGLDGLEMCRAIRGTDYGRYVYILLITATGNRSDYVKCLEAGADDFMAKPVDPATLAVRVIAAQRILAYDQALQAQARKLALARQQMDNDLAAAGNAQRALLPAPDTRRLLNCSIGALFIPAQQVSGDMFNYFELDPTRIGFYAADVAGHGVRSGLVAATLGHIISPGFFVNRIVDRDSTGAPDPASLVRRMNERFAQRDYEDTYFTIVLGIIDCAAGTLSFCQAGHPHPLLVRPDGTSVWLGDGGLPVGMFADASWSSERVAFEAGSRLVVYSDGITEAMAPDGELFGEDRLQAFVTGWRPASGQDICHDLADELKRWMHDVPNTDDVTMIMIERQE